MPLAGNATLPQLGRALVFTERDRRLWLVGSDAATGVKSRLYVIDADSGTVEAVRELVSGLERFWLTTGEDNAVVMIAAPDAAPWYRIVVFEPETNLTAGVPRVSGVVQRQARSLGTLRVDGGAVLAPEVENGPLGNPHKPPKLGTAVVLLSEVPGHKQGAVFIDGK